MEDHSLDAAAVWSWIVVLDALRWEWKRHWAYWEGKTAHWRLVYRASVDYRFGYWFLVVHSHSGRVELAAVVAGHRVRVKPDSLLASAPHSGFDANFI